MLTFFDIPSSLSRAWSPNTWKVRYYLNYHRIPYRTQWIELPLIESTCTSLGIPPSKVQPPSTAYPEGHKAYTLPAVYDATTNTYISESARILKYLDGRYPSTTSAQAFPKGTSVVVPLWDVITPDIAKMLNDESRVYFEETRRAVFQGRTLAEGKNESWEKVNKGLADVGRKGQGVFVTGDKPVFSDFVIAATFAYMRNVWGEDHERWKEVLTWDNDRWARFVDALREFEEVK
ncbi:hypothetical protein FA13DRAFT_1736178 [Coprinellus micaceus]|uniref:GST N-terminal domain-containing protein n=1 Tax=Coprinellus micaceus TaxID=71717 RepID=A0A4Y7T128_COPMI|nr:hypothetical protein FA13DRAFT_1736178 [Coprinellus micaceus]